MTERDHDTPPAAARADVGPPTPRRVGPYLLGLAVVSFAGAATVVAMRAEPRQSAERSMASSIGECATPEGEVWTPPEESSHWHGIVSETVSELVRTSDLILVGTAQETRVAKVIAEGPDDEFPTRTVHTAVAVEEVLGEFAAGGCVVVSTDELAFRAPGLEDWRERGSRVLLFLTRSQEPSEPDVYVLQTSFQSAYVVVGDELEITALPGDDVTGLNRRIAATSLPLLRERVRAVQP